MVDTTLLPWYAVQTMPLHLRGPECRRRWRRSVDQALVILSSWTDDCVVHDDLRAEATLLDVSDVTNAMGWFSAAEVWLKRSHDVE